jgi:hypothetical protein
MYILRYSAFQGKVEMLTTPQMNKRGTYLEQGRYWMVWSRRGGCAEIGLCLSTAFVAFRKQKAKPSAEGACAVAVPHAQLGPTPLRALYPSPSAAAIVRPPHPGKPFTSRSIVSSLHDSNRKKIIYADRRKKRKKHKILRKESARTFRRRSSFASALRMGLSIRWPCIEARCDLACLIASAPTRLADFSRCNSPCQRRRELI